MNATTDASHTAAEPSLLPIRLAAAVGLVVAVAVVAGGFLYTWWAGLIALFFAPVLPMVCVLAVEALRRSE
ncbi:MAG: hypothetical protein AAF548_09520 [Actinomycetota bacterium]